MRQVILLCTLILAACSSSGSDVQVGPSIYGRDLLKNVNFDVYEGAHDAEQELVDAAHHVSRTLDDLARVQYSESNPEKMKDETSAEKLGMSDLGSVDWSGPVEPIVRQIAKASNYRVRVLGNKPAIPVLITIKKTNASLAEIIRDIKYQANKNAKIQIYPKSHVIEIRYLKA